MSSIRLRRRRLLRFSRRGFSLAHGLTIILLVGIILSMLGFTLVSLRKMKGVLNSQLQSEQTWRRFSRQFRQDCHAALDIVWRDEVPDTPSPSRTNSAQEPLADSESSADAVLAGGRKLTFLRADGAAVEYIVLKQRVVRRERVGDSPPRWDSFVLPDGMQLQWSWRRREANIFALRLLDAPTADELSEFAPRGGRRVRTLISVVGLDGNQIPGDLGETP